MTYTSVFSERSKKELMESWLWYEDRQYGLGGRFNEAVLKTVVQIQNNPLKGLSRNSIFREAIVKTFPFLIIYRIYEDNKTIFIHSIFHAKRSPKRKYEG